MLRQPADTNNTRDTMPYFLLRHALEQLAPEVGPFAALIGRLGSHQGLAVGSIPVLRVKYFFDFILPVRD
ncbi:MAG: hypothetical protein WAK48_23030 [Candidatus Acidiferrum sp.]